MNSLTLALFVISFPASGSLASVHSIASQATCVPFHCSQAESNAPSTMWSRTTVLIIGALTERPAPSPSLEIFRTPVRSDHEYDWLELRAEALPRPFLRCPRHNHETRR